MFASLRFPGNELCRESRLSPGTVPEEIQKILQIPPLQTRILNEYLFLSCPNPAVLEYRAALGEELRSNLPLQKALEAYGTLYLSLEPLTGGGTEETALFRSALHFERFSRGFDRFCRILPECSAQSEAGRRFLRYCKAVSESFEYRELRVKAGELIRDFGFQKGFTLTVGSPLAEEGTVRLQRNEAAPEGLQPTAEALLRQFGGEISKPNPVSRPYTETETAVLTGILRREPKLLRRLEEFHGRYGESGLKNLFLLGKEAVYYTLMNRLYQRAEEAGLPLCRPSFRNPGFYSEIRDLAYLPPDEPVGRADFVSTPFAPITVVAGPHGEAYGKAVEFAHIAASAGGLLFAREAEIAPVDRIERDTGGEVNADYLTAESLCIALKCFDTLLPRQEEGAVSTLIKALSNRTTGSLIRICSKSNLTLLQKQTEGGQLPRCTLLLLGKDPSLEELLQRHKTPRKEDSEWEN